MSRIVVDGVKESDGIVFKTIKAGTYPVRCANVEEKVSKPEAKHPGQPYLNFVLKTTDEETKGTTLWWMVNLPNEDMDESEKQMAVDAMRHTLDAFALPAPEDGGIDTQDFINGECTAVVIEKTQDGVKRNQVKDILLLKAE